MIEGSKHTDKHDAWDAGGYCNAMVVNEHGDGVPCGYRAPQPEPVYVRPDWSAYFLGIAHSAAARSTCKRRQVGAVLVDPDNRIVATGYNGSPSGEAHCIDGACPRGQLSYDQLAAGMPYDEGAGRCIADHAERNARTQAQDRGIDVTGFTMYVTHEPCQWCAEEMEAAGITPIWPR